MTRLPARRPVRSMPVASRSQRGFSLIVALMMLIVIILLGIGASQMAINEERAARNDRDRQIAFQAAEAALKDAEKEILAGPTGPYPCAQAGQPPSNGRPAAPGSGQTCFNQENSANYVTGCSTYPNEGLCDSGGAKPDWMNVDFLADAVAAAGGATNGVKTTEFGRFTGQTFASQKGGTSALGITLPVSVYPPRYIIELVPKNTSVTGQPAGAGGGLGGGHMFRVTAMGFGASASSQVVLQSVVATVN